MTNKDSDSTDNFVDLERFIESLNSSSALELDKLYENENVVQIVSHFQNSKDILVRLNSVELLGQIAAVKGTFSALSRLNVCKILCNACKQVSVSDTDSRLLLPSLLKFFANLCDADAFGFQQTVRNDQLLDILTVLFEGVCPHSDLFDSNFQVRQLCDALVVWIGAIGHSSTGLELLFEQYNQHNVSSTASLLGLFVNQVWPNVSSTLSVTALETLSCFLESKGPSNIVQAIWEQLDQRAPVAVKDAKLVSFLVKSAKSSITEVSVAGYSCLVNLTSHDWGMSLMTVYLGEHLPWLFERSTANTKLELEWRYSLVQCIWEKARSSEHRRDWFPSEDTLKAFEIYVKQGPFHASSSVNVATVGASR